MNDTAWRARATGPCLARGACIGGVGVALHRAQDGCSPDILPGCCWHECIAALHTFACAAVYPYLYTPMPTHPLTHSLPHSLTRRTASSYGFDMRCIKSLAMAEPLVDTVEPNQVCSSTALLRTFDITTMTKEDATFESDFKLKLTRCVHCARAGTVACNYAVAEGALSAFTQSG